MDNEMWEYQTADGRHMSQQAWLSSTFAEVVKLMEIASNILSVVYDLNLAAKLAWKSSHITDI
jgi:hypothetical protein